MSQSFTHLVFVDFENVPSVDLALIAGKPVHVTLVIGEKQKRLEVGLVRQIHQHAAQVSLIEVGASGRNALDVVLAAHLGRATVEHPKAEFVIVSRDRDFDPLVAHFGTSGRRVAREPDFSALPIFGMAKAAPTVKPPRPVAAKPGPAARKPVVSGPSPEATRQKKMASLTENLRAKSGRPKTRDSLLHHINTMFGQKLSPDESEAVLQELLAGGCFTIPDGKKVVYAG